ncbi:OsmC family protein [Rhizobium paknamense]|uniref:Osmotically inducible protein OsmC n=1 Tax=Rhizobium paknamense TaxID=1206817 RepID=A0ABU0ICK5_9HYPH|nr:OsmC family protein [Rhizobium paknamense]MDQ0455921.1 osmotically inducible protein OsmC [Rhizobium paknamense]
MVIKKHGSAHWSGGLKDGKGSVSTESGALKEQPYGFNIRFGGEPGTNPEELIGAALASCYSMALSKTVQDAGFTAESLETKAVVSLDQQDGGFAITGIELTLNAKVSGADEAKVRDMAEQTKVACPVSKALKAVPIGLTVNVG